MNIDDLTEDRKYEFHWQMARCERLAMVQILRRLSPSLSIEIGAYKGGSLQVIAEYSEHVLSLDRRPEVLDLLSGAFPNVDFTIGDSRETLPAIVEDLNGKQESPGFVLIDGCHSTEGVREDITQILRITPRKPMVILMHDSFNPACRRGMLTAPWSACPFVQAVDLDFVPGLFSETAYDTAEAGSMWSGFGCAIVTPQHREVELEIRQAQRKVVEAVERISIHRSQSIQASATPSLLRVGRAALRSLRRRFTASEA